MLLDVQEKSLFRTRAWVESWLDVWGNDPRIQLVDLGGKGNPLEMMYLIHHKLKGMLPVRTLVIAGYGFAHFDPPRAEYNNLDSFIAMAGGIKPLADELSKLEWNQWVIPDLSFDIPVDSLADISNVYRWNIFNSRDDTAYRIDAKNFDVYTQQLSGSTHAKYFKRREKLAKYGVVELVDIESENEFFNIINQFHISRWGRPCYSIDSMRFFSLFIERIRMEGGAPIMQCMQVGNETVSVIFDIVWKGVRYNLQSGYLERRFPQVALGAIHLGFSIEKSIHDGLVYDMLAGEGKYTNYKEKISTQSVPMNSYCFAKGWLKYAYHLYGK